MLVDLGFASELCSVELLDLFQHKVDCCIQACHFVVGTAEQCKQLKERLRVRAAARQLRFRAGILFPSLCICLHNQFRSTYNGKQFAVIICNHVLTTCCFCPVTAQTPGQRVAMQERNTELQRSLRTGVLKYY